MIFVGSEIINDHNRSLYKRAFGIDSLEFYGSTEMGTIAFEISGKKGLVLCDDLTVFEFLDEKNRPVKPGKIGKIVVTDLMGKTMPFIRSMNVEPVILEKTQCDMNYACLSDKAVCNVEPFVDRELQLLRCRDERSCAFKRNYQGQYICSCPVIRASFGYK